MARSSRSRSATPGGPGVVRRGAHRPGFSALIDRIMDMDRKLADCEACRDGAARVAT